MQSYNRLEDSFFAINSVIAEIMEHRRKFYHVGYMNYNKELPATIQIVFLQKYNGAKQIGIFNNYIL